MSETTEYMESIEGSPARAFIADAGPGYWGDIRVAIVERELRTTNGRSRLTAVLQDKTGRIEAVMWRDAEKVYKELAPGDVIDANGNVGEFNGRPQFSIESYTKLAPGAYAIAEVMAASRHNPAEMYNSLLAAVSTKVENRFIRELLEQILRDNRAGLTVSAAAMKVHHAFAAGLLEHIVSMARAATLLCRNYPRLDQSLMIAGCILHDIGKLRELSTGITIDYTVEGTLLGHVQIGCEMLNEALLVYDGRALLADESKAGFPRALAVKLKHLILSHHGQREYGAAVLPMTPEAIALHMVDKLDANLEQAWREIDGAAGEDFTAYIPALERRLYRGDKFEGVA